MIVQLAMVTHAPLGAPSVTFDTDYCHLAQDDYVTGYSHELRTPLWTSFTLQNPQVWTISPLFCGYSDVFVCLLACLFVCLFVCVTAYATMTFNPSYFSHFSNLKYISLHHFVYVFKFLFVAGPQEPGVRIFFRGCSTPLNF